MAVLVALLASSTNEDSSGIGILIIPGVLLLVVLAIAAVWTFAARRGSRTPTRTPHDRDQGVRGS